MLDLSFFTTLKLGWLNAWIPAFGMVVIQFVYMGLFREVGKRAVDTSWYTPRDKFWAMVSTFLQIVLLVLSIFVPFKLGTAWFLIGSTTFALSFAAFIWSFHSYGIDPAGKTIKSGIYRWSRNPMYFFFFTGMLGNLYCFGLALAAHRHCSLRHRDALHHPWRRALLRTNLWERVFGVQG